MLTFGAFGSAPFGALPEDEGGPATASGFMPVGFGTPAATLGDPPGVLYSDTFAGAGTLSGHTPETGTEWIAISGALSYWTKTGSGGVRRTTPKADDFAAIRSQPGLTLPAAGYADFVFRITDNSASADSQFRCELVSDPLGYNVNAFIEHNVWNGTQWSEVRINSSLGGSHLYLADPGGLSSLAVDTDYTIRIEWDGIVWTIYLDGVALGSANVTAPPPLSHAVVRNNMWAAGTNSYELRLVEIVESEVSAAPQLGNASGFKPTNLGTPTATPDSVGTASGFKPINFGTPQRAAESTQAAASSLRVGTFGTPSTPIARSFGASGFMVTKFPRYPLVPVVFADRVNRRHFRVVTLRCARFGTPSLL